MLPDPNLTGLSTESGSDPGWAALPLDDVRDRFHETLSLHYVTESRKAPNAPCNAHSTSLGAMSDPSWKSAQEAWQRVRWARERIYSNMAEAAEALEMPASTYRQYEREPGTSRWATLDQDHAKDFARKFKVNWVWLLTGVGSPQKDASDAASELVEIYQKLGSHQQQLLMDLARNLTGGSSNVVAVDALPAGPTALRARRKAG